MLIAFYYGLTGAACVWWFRRDLGKGARHLVLKGILPGLGAAILIFFFYGAKQFWSKAYGNTYWTLPFPPHWQIGGVFLTGIGSLVLGVILMVIYRALNPAFFKGRTLNRNSELLVLESDVEAGTFGADPEGAGL